MRPPLLLDLSRLLSRADRIVPTGIDRVELAYAEHFLAGGTDHVDFAAMTSWGRFGPVSRTHAQALVAALRSVWQGETTDGAARRKELGRLARAIRFELIVKGAGPVYASLKRAGGRPVYLLVSHHHLHRPAAIARLKARTGARFVCFVHDLIPIAYPEYARPGQAARHLVRMKTVAALADAVIVNSAATGTELAALFAPALRLPPVAVAPLGVDRGIARPTAPDAPPEVPYFLCVGTIEPRKNHLLLLHLWRRFAEEWGPRAPRLVIAGQRGWEIEHIVDVLERCAALTGLVEERNDLSDGALLRLMHGARALLLPSFAEGYGLPVAEALAAGVPVLCSDLPALREVGGDAAEFLDPLDGLAWHDAIADYMSGDSPRRAAQLARISTWRAPGWDAHFRIVETLF